jgi:hypothetical protein
MRRAIPAWPRTPLTVAQLEGGLVERKIEKAG